MTTVTRAEYERMLEIARTKNGLAYSPLRPYPAQVNILSLLADSESSDILWAGQSGSGKTIIACFAALQYVHLKNYSVCIIRNTTKQSKDTGNAWQTLIEWLTNGKNVSCNKVENRISFPSGAKIQLRYLDNEKDKYAFKSSQYSRIIIDEASEILPENLSYMQSRVRQDKTSTIRTKILYLTNPGGPSSEWLYDRFIGENKLPGYIWIPAKLDDNLALDIVDYRNRLKNLSETEYRRLALGEWIHDTSELVYHKFSRNMNIQHGIHIATTHHIIGIDLGYVDDSAITVIGYYPSSTKIFVQYCRKFEKINISDLAAKILELQDLYNPLNTVIDAAGGGKQIAAELIERHGISLMPAIKIEKDNYIKLINDGFYRKEISIHADCIDLINELGTLRRNKHGKENATDANHACDSFLYAFKQARNITPIVDTKPKNQQEEIDAYLDNKVYDRLNQSPEDNIMRRMYGGR